MLVSLNAIEDEQFYTDSPPPEFHNVTIIGLQVALTISATLVAGIGDVRWPIFKRGGQQWTFWLGHIFDCRWLVAGMFYAEPRSAQCQMAS
jgi:hypothetical protein